MEIPKVNYIKFANETMFSGLKQNEEKNWYRILLRLLGETYKKDLDNLVRLVGYNTSVGPGSSFLDKDVVSSGNIISWADVREPKKEEHDSPWPYLFDHELLYLSRNYREKIAHAKFREKLEIEGKFRTDNYDDSRGRLIDFGLSPWDVASIIILHLEKGCSLLKPVNEFYIGTKYSRKFRIKAYYQKPTPKRYPMGSVGIVVDENPMFFDTWHNSIQGTTRVFFSAGAVKLREKKRKTISLRDRHPLMKIMSSDAI